MTLTGHVHNGAIVLDNQIALAEGTPVQVEVWVAPDGESRSMPFRGAQPYVFEDPFSPAIPESDWEAAR